MSYSPAHPAREIWCYVRSSFTVVRMVVDATLVLFAVFWSAFGGWSHPWTKAAELLWQHAHMALVIFEVGIHPPDVGLTHVVCLERLHLFVYRALALWSLTADTGVIVDSAQDVDKYGDSEYVERLCIASVVAAMNLWRLMEVFSFLSPMTVHKERPQLQ